jgi:hypothetical protein
MRALPRYSINADVPLRQSEPRLGTLRRIAFPRNLLEIFHNFRHYDPV